MKTVTHLNHMCMHILCFCLSSPSSPKKPITRIKMINKQEKNTFSFIYACKVTKKLPHNQPDRHASRLLYAYYKIFELILFSHLATV